MLKVENLNVFHGLIEAVHDVSLMVPVGQCVSLLGPNGAGKTSTFPLSRVLLNLLDQFRLKITF